VTKWFLYKLSISDELDDVWGQLQSSHIMIPGRVTVLGSLFLLPGGYLLVLDYSDGGDTVVQRNEPSPATLI